MEYGLGGLASGLATGIGQGLALNRQDALDKQGAEAHVLAMQEGQQGLAAGAEKLTAATAIDNNTMDKMKAQAAEDAHVAKVKTFLAPIVNQIAIGDKDGAMKSLVDGVNNDSEFNKGYNFALSADAAGKPIVDANGNYTAIQTSADGRTIHTMVGTPDKFALQLANSANPLQWADQQNAANAASATEASKNAAAMALQDKKGKNELDVQGLRNKGESDNAHIAAESRVREAGITAAARIKAAQVRSQSATTPQIKNYNMLMQIHPDLDPDEAWDMATNVNKQSKQVLSEKYYKLLSGSVQYLGKPVSVIKAAADAMASGEDIPGEAPAVAPSQQPPSAGRGLNPGPSGIKPDPNATPQGSPMTPPAAAATTGTDLSYIWKPK